MHVPLWLQNRHLEIRDVLNKDYWKLKPVEICEEMKLNTPGKCAFHSPFLFFPKMFPFHRNVYDFLERDGSETVFPWQFATTFFLRNFNYNQMNLGLSFLKHAAPFFNDICQVSSIVIHKFLQRLKFALNRGTVQNRCFWNRNRHIQVDLAHRETSKKPMFEDDLRIIEK